MGPAIKTGLIYSSVTAMVERLKLPDAERDELVDDLLILETAGINAG